MTDLLTRLKALFASGPIDPPSVRKLSAGTEDTLATSIDGLLPGEPGWITFEEGRALFSPRDDQYAFGKLDLPGQLKLGAFAVDHLAELDLSDLEIFG
jgi:hypothetical protein